MTHLRDLIRTTPVAGDATWTCPSGYRQGRGAWGGLVVGAFLDAAQRLVGDPALEPRSLTSHLLAPVPAGEVHIDLTVLREGSNTTTISALMHSPEADREGAPTGDAVVVADAVVVFGSSRVADLDFTAPVWNRLEPPPALSAGWSNVPVLDLPPGLAPEFLQNLRVRPVSGYPYGGGTDAEVIGWVSPPEGVVAHPTVLAALADAWWPGALVPLTGLRPAATLAFSLDLVALPTTDEPLLHRGRVVAANDGYVAETRELWSADGRLLSHNQQTIVIIR